MSGVLVVAETRRRELRDISFELITAGLGLVQQGAERLIVAVVTEDAPEAARSLSVRGVQEIVTIAAPVEHPQSAVSEQALEALIADLEPDIILLGQTVDGLGFGGSVAARQQLGFAADVVAVELDSGVPVARCSAYGDRFTACVEFPEHDCVLAMIRPGSHEPATDAHEVPIRELIVDFDPARVANTEHVAFRDPEVGDVDITRSDFLLSIGRGVRERDQLERLARLAANLGATLTVSRPLVDAGWAPASLQVGQSGKVVKPKVYLALGISGAMQHLAGMANAETIIAVNTDPQAPIFTVADYGAVVDLFEVVAALEARVDG